MLGAEISTFLKVAGIRSRNSFTGAFLNIIPRHRTTAHEHLGQSQRVDDFSAHPGFYGLGGYGQLPRGGFLQFAGNEFVGSTMLLVELSVPASDPAGISVKPSNALGLIASPGSTDTETNPVNFSGPQG